MIVDGINLIDGVIKNAAVESGITLPLTNLDTGRLFYLSQIDGIHSPGLYVYNGTDWETSGQVGDITGVVAGTGLTGGGNTGSVQLDIDPAVVATIAVTDNLNSTKVNKTGDLMSGALDMGTNGIVNLSSPTLSTDAANKQYVDAALGTVDLSGKVSIAGDTMTGFLWFQAGVGLYWSDSNLTVLPDASSAGGLVVATSVAAAIHRFVVAGVDTLKISQTAVTVAPGVDLILNTTPVSDQHAANKLYVDNAVLGVDLSSRVAKTGDSMTGSLSFQSGTGLSWPSNSVTLLPDGGSGLVISTNSVTASHKFAVGGSVQMAISLTDVSLAAGVSLTLAQDPTLNLQASTKQYVDNAVLAVDLSSRVAKAGDAMTGSLSMGTNSVSFTGVGAAGVGGELSFVGASTTVYAPSVAGGLTFDAPATGSFVNVVNANAITTVDTGGLTINSGNITLNADPTLALQAATKQYVDGSVVNITGKVNVAGDTMTGALILNADPSVALGAATKQYVDAAETASVTKAGDTMTGALILNADPSVALGAATKQYVDSGIGGINLSGLVAKAGDTMTGALTLNADPINDLHAATKRYVDGVATGLDVKASVRVATVANITLSGAQTIDGVAVIAGDRVLVKDQSIGSQNGIYDAASGAWIRSSDADNTPANEVTSGMFTFVEEGLLNASSGWALATADPITLDVTSLSFSQFSGAGQITAGTGISKSGDTLSLDTGNSRNVDHSTIDMIAGTGMTGGGTITGNRTFNVVGGNGIVANANDIALDTGNVRNVSHSAVSIVAGSGLSGGGDITASRTLNIGAGTGITVAANSIAFDTIFGDARYIQQAENAASATKLNTARTISLGGDLSGSASFDGTANITITATVDNTGTYTDNRTTNKTLVSLETVFVNTSAGILTMTLPGAPTLGDQVTIIDLKGTFGTNKCIVGRNGGVIMGLTQNMDITTNNASVTLIYSNAADGWRIKQ